MALLKAYVSSRNNAFPDVSTSTRTAQSWAWLLKQILINAAGINAFDATWTDGLTHALPVVTVVGSSDSSTAGMDNVDRWGGTFDPSKLVSANDGTPHAWIVLKFPNGICSLAGGKGPVYLCIDIDQGNVSVAARVTVAASFAGYTGGSTTNRPTASDEIITDYGNQQGITTSDSTAVARSMHLTFAADGTFFMVASKNGSGHPETGVVMFETTQTRPGHNRPLILGTDFQASNAAFQINGGYWNSGSQYPFSSMSGWNSTGSVKLAFSGAYPSLSSVGVVFSTSTFGGGGDMEDGKFNDAPIQFWGLNSAQNQHTCVVAVDWAYGPYVNNATPPLQASPEPSVGQTEAVLVGSTFMPFSGVPTF